MCSWVKPMAPIDWCEMAAMRCANSDAWLLAAAIEKLPPISSPPLSASRAAALLFSQGRPLGMWAYVVVDLLVAGHPALQGCVRGAALPGVDPIDVGRIGRELHD